MCGGGICGRGACGQEGHVVRKGMCGGVWWGHKWCRGGKCRSSGVCARQGKWPL